MQSKDKFSNGVDGGSYYYGLKVADVAIVKWLLRAHESSRANGGDWIWDNQCVDITQPIEGIIPDMGYGIT